MRQPWSLLVMVALLVALAGCGGARKGSSAQGLSPLPYEDAFDDPTGGWYTEERPEVTIAYRDGALHILVQVEGYAAWSVVERRFRDFIVEVDATQVEGPDNNSYGLILRHVDDDHFYRFDISGDGYYNIQKWVDGEPQGLIPDWTPSEAIHQGAATNHLRVVARGPTMTFYVNGVELAQVEDGDYPEGRIGLVVGTFLDAPGAHIAFDNLRVLPVGE